MKSEGMLAVKIIEIDRQQPTQLTYAFPGNGAKNFCWYFVTSTSKRWSFSPVPVKPLGMPDIGANKCLDISYSNY